MPKLPFNALAICIALTVADFSRADALDAWQWRAALPQGNDLTAIAKGNGLYVAVGDHATILTSADGTNWQKRSLEIPRRIRSLAFGNGRFVAVGYDLQEPAERDFILTSTNGLNWQDASTGTSQVLRHVIFFGGRFLAFGYNTPGRYRVTLLVSTNGLDWVDPIDPEDEDIPSPPSFDGITTGKGLLVAGDGTSFFVSSNGIGWTEVAAPLRGMENVRFLNGLFVAAGHDDDYQDTGQDRPSFALSTNGLDWIAGSATDYSFYDDDHYVEVTDLGFVNGAYIAVGSYRSGLPAYWYSPNGLNWHLYALGLFDVPEEIWNENGRLLAVGRSGLLATSLEGTTWLADSSPPYYRSLAVAHGNNRFVAVGEKGFIQVSTNGTQWHSQILGLPGNVTWTDVAFGSNRFVAVSASGRLMRSEDGANWATQHPMGISLFPGGIPYRGVGYGGGKFVAVGGSGWSTHGIMVSDDGNNWIPRLIGTGFSLWSVAHGQGRYVAVGSAGNILVSSNASDWVQVTVPSDAYFRSITFGNGRFVATGGRAVFSPVYPLAYHSTNGLDWFGGTLPLTTTPYFTLDRVAYGHGVFVAGSAGASLSGGGMIFTSTDGQSWQQRHSPTMQNVSGIAVDGRSFVVLGPSGMILQSAELRPRLQLDVCCPEVVYQLSLTGGISNTFWRVDWSTNLTDWVAQSTHRLTGTNVVVLQGGALPPRRFYRAQSEAP